MCMQKVPHIYVFRNGCINSQTDPHFFHAICMTKESGKKEKKEKNKKKK